MNLYHFSEDPTIAVFRPRPIPTSSAYSTPPPPDRAADLLVWAIDEEHAPLYWFPRDCPRVAYCALPTSISEDLDRFFGHTTAQWVIAIESAWLARMQQTKLYAYHLPGDSFESHWDSSTPYYLSREPVTPLAVELVGDLLTRHAAAGIELRITPSLWPLRRALLDTTLHFSMIRMRNAQPEVTA